MVQPDRLGRLLGAVPRSVPSVTPVSVHVTGSWARLLAQVVYTRADPTHPGHDATLVAAHHPDLPSAGRTSSRW